MVKSLLQCRPIVRNLVLLLSILAFHVSVTEALRTFPSTTQFLKNDQFYPDKRHFRQYSHVLYAQSSTASTTINTAVLKAIGKLLSTCGVGVWAGRVGLLDQNALSVLSKLIFIIFQPCLLFTNVANTVSQLSKTGGGAAVYILPFAATLQIFIGFVVGKMVSALCYRSDPDGESAKQLRVCTTFANSGPLPLVFTDGLLQSHADPTLISKSIAYISLYLLGWSPWFWIVAPGILSEKKDESIGSRSDNFKVLAKRVFSPPVVGSMLGMIVGGIPLLSKLIVGGDGIFNPVFQALKTLGTAYLPAVLLVLAGSLSASGEANGDTLSPIENKNENKMQSIIRKAKENQQFALQVVMIYIARFLLMPSMAFGIIGLSTKYIPAVKTLFQNDPLLVLILLLEACMPSAQNTTVILQLQGKKSAAGRLARTLMMVYVLGIPAMSYWMIKILEFTAI